MIEAISLDDPMAAFLAREQEALRALEGKASSAAVKGPNSTPASPTLPALYPKDLYRRPLDTPAMQEWRAARTAAIAARESQATAKLAGLGEKARVRLQDMASARKEGAGEAKRRLDEANAQEGHLVGPLNSHAPVAGGGQSVEEIDWSHMLRIIEAVHQELGRTGRPTDERNSTKMIQMIASMTVNE